MGGENVGAGATVEVGATTDGVKLVGGVAKTIVASVDEPRLSTAFPRWVTSFLEAP